MIPDYNYKMMCCIKRTEKKTPDQWMKPKKRRNERGRIRGKHEDCSRKDRDKQLKGDREGAQKLQ